MRRVVPAAEAYLDKPVPVLDHGFVCLVDYMGSDEAVAEAARVSTAGEGVRSRQDDEVLIRYLMSYRHTSPSEMVELKFHCAMPIFVARQWVRHRTASLNEMSGRYSQLPELTYVPPAERISWQSPSNKQGSGSVMPESLAKHVREEWGHGNFWAFSFYKELLGTGDYKTFDVKEQEVIRSNGGVSRELARINLPLSTYTQWYWKIDLHNLLHFLELRLDEHAQWELRQYAEVIARMVEALCPLSWKAFVDYRLEAVRFSGPEWEVLREIFRRVLAGAPVQVAVGTDFPEQAARLSKRELVELGAKLAKLGINT